MFLTVGGHRPPQKQESSCRPAVQFQQPVNAIRGMFQAVGWRTARLKEKRFYLGDEVARVPCLEARGSRGPADDIAGNYRRAERDSLTHGNRISIGKRWPDKYVRA